MALKHMVFALAVHAGAIALAFGHVMPREWRPAGETSLLARLESTRTEVMPFEDAEFELEAPEVEASDLPEAESPREPELPEPRPEPAPEPPEEFIEPPEETLPDIRPVPETRLTRPPEEPEAEEAPAEEPVEEEPVEEPVEEAAESEPTASRAPKPGDVPEADEPPRLLSPDWPREIRRRFTGQVLVAVVVSPAGSALSVEVIEGTGNADWDESLRETFRGSVYIPGRTQGAPVVCTHQFRITFRRR